MLCVKRRKHGRGLQRRAIQQPCFDKLARRKTRPVLMCNGCERPPRGKQATYKRLRRKHNGRQCLCKQIGRENQRPCALRQRRDGCFPALSPPVGCKGTCKRQRMRLFVRRAVRFVCPRFFGRPTGMNFVFIRGGQKTAWAGNAFGEPFTANGKALSAYAFPSCSPVSPKATGLC